METLLLVGCILYCLQDYSHERNQEQERIDLYEQVIELESEMLIMKDNYTKLKSKKGKDINERTDRGYSEKL